MPLMTQLTRRAALRLGAGAVAGAASTWALNALLEPARGDTAPAPFEPPAGATLPTRMSGSFVSPARGGQTTNWVITLPPGLTPGPTPDQIARCVR